MSGELGAVVYAADLDRMSSFYRGALGLEPERAGDGFVLLARGDAVVTLVQIPPHILATFTIADPPDRREDAAVKLSFGVTSIAAAREAAGGLGGVVDPPHAEWEFGAVRVCDGHDPEGNVIQVRESR